MTLKQSNFCLSRQNFHLKFLSFKECISTHMARLWSDRVYSDLHISLKWTGVILLSLSIFFLPRNIPGWANSSAYWNNCFKSALFFEHSWHTKLYNVLPNLTKYRSKRSEPSHETSWQRRVNAFKNKTNAFAKLVSFQRVWSLLFIFAPLNCVFSM